MGRSLDLFSSINPFPWTLTLLLKQKNRVHGDMYNDDVNDMENGKEGRYGCPVVVCETHAPHLQHWCVLMASPLFARNSRSQSSFVCPVRDNNKSSERADGKHLHSPVQTHSSDPQQLWPSRRETRLECVCAAGQQTIAQVQCEL